MKRVILHENSKSFHHYREFEVKYPIHSLQVLHWSRAPKIGVGQKGAQRNLSLIWAATLTAAAACPENSRPCGIVSRPGAYGETAVYISACVATFLAAVSRVSFSVLAVPIQQQYGLKLSDMGLLQSALLMGYVLGQIPAGIVADRLGGVRTITTGLIVWSLAVFAMAATPSPSSNNYPLLFILLARATVGLAQSVLMPGISATAAQWFAPSERGAKTSDVYAWYSLGTVFGLIATPTVAHAVGGWPAVFGVFGIVGTVAGVACLHVLPAERQHASPVGRVSGPRYGMRIQHHASDLALLCWTHAVIGFGFFVLQSWVPTFLHSLGMTDLTAVGFFSAMPWLATASVAALAGRLSGWLQIERQWTAVRVRRAMQSIANLGGLLALLPLAVCGARASPGIATAALTLAIALQGFNYAGYHSYVQDVSPKDAGLILGLTNTCSSLAGIAGNLATGILADSNLGFGAVFGLGAFLYATSLVTWLAFADGRAISLTHS